jgi:hypothetical protein
MDTHLPYNLTPFEIWYGRDASPPERIPLRAGPLQLEFQEGDLRYIRFADQELFRRLTVAIRDPHWGTIPGVRSDLDLQSGQDQFRLSFRSHHQSGELDYEWTASILGQADGSLVYTMRGFARRDFSYCRIGFCLLHPIQGCAGQPYRAQTPDGLIAGRLPVLVEPQLMRGGFEAPIFPSCSSLVVEHASGIELQAEFEGDLFETEDQRNWTDGSFKTYCTPLALGYPHQARAGQEFYQKVTLRASPPAGWMAVPATVEGPVRLELSAPSRRRLPQLGFGLPCQGQDPTPRQAGLLAALQPDYLKAELYFAQTDWPAELERARRVARQVGARLEVALFLTDEPEADLEQLRALLTGAPLARLLVFHAAEAATGVTAPEWVERVRAGLGASFSDLPLVGGTAGNFAELNRARPEVRRLAGICYPINPQVHAWDERSLVETLEGQRDTLITARSFSGGLPIIVSSVTLKPPPGVDERQMSLFAAAWTVGSLAALVTGGASAMTYYETIGQRGLIESDQGGPAPQGFRSYPGMAFPVYHVFADLADRSAAEAVPLLSTAPLRLTGLALRFAGGWRILAANLTCEPLQGLVGPLSAGSAVRRRLNHATAQQAMITPEQFRQVGAPFQLEDKWLACSLDPFEVLRIDLQTTGRSD